MKRRSIPFLPALTVIGFAAAPFSSSAAELFDLGRALTRIGQETGREIVFSSDIVRGKHASSLPPPRASVEEQLTAVLAGTGLRWRINDGGTILIEVDSSSDTRTDLLTDSFAQEEITVTAQRRDERGQEVPVSVTGFGPNAIDAYRLERLRDISRLTPGLLVSSFSQSSPTIAIRGASNTFTQIGANKPVAIVVDDVFVPRNSAADFDLFGLHSIQVLRGPQGTLFGRNVTGGAILLDTGKPAFDRTAGKLRLTAGDYSAYAAEGLIDLPAGERASFRVTGSIHEHDGYGRDRLTGREQDDQDSRAVRAQARLQITSDLEVLLGADMGADDSGGRTLSSISAGNDNDRRTSELGVPQHFERDQNGGSARVFWDIGSGTLTSITAIRNSETRDIYSNVGANYLFLTGTQSQLMTDDADDVSAFSQEVRYASPLWSQGNFVAGIYYVDEDSKRLLRTTALAAITGNTIIRQDADQAVDSRSLAAFIDGTIKMPANLALTVGLRYTDDRKTASLIRTDFLTPRNSFTASELERSWDELTPRAILSWAPVPDLHTYLSYSRGYTAGGFNTEAATLAALTQPFAPETVDNYEGGIKSDWLNDRLRINAAAFLMKYKDKQELFFNNLTRILNITNAAAATSKGIEVETRGVLTPWLTLNATYGFLDTRYDEFVIPGGAVFTGNPLSSSPRHKISFSPNINLPLGSWGELLGTAVYSRMSSYFTGASADAGLRVPAYDLVNLSVGLTPADGQWTLTGFVRNLADTEYLLTPSTQTVRAEYLGEPRTVGLTLTYNF